MSLITSHPLNESSLEGVFFIIPCVDIYEKIDMRTATYEIPPQEVISSLSSHHNFVNLVDWIKKWPYAAHRAEIRSPNSHCSDYMPVPKLSQSCLTVQAKLSPIFVKVVPKLCHSNVKHVTAVSNWCQNFVELDSQLSQI